MKCWILAIMLLTGAVSCDNAATEVVPLNGTYIGYFHRSGKDTARVTLRFEDNHFDGSSNKEAYPFIGNGLFRQSENTVSFIPPAGASPATGTSPSLQGEYNYAYDDDGTIRLWKTGEEAEDEFILKVYLAETSAHAAKIAKGTVSSTLE